MFDLREQKDLIHSLVAEADEKSIKCCICY